MERLKFMTVGSFVEIFKLDIDHTEPLRGDNPQ
jgi:hypothetical protein